MVEGAEIHTRRFGVVTAKNLTDEIAKYLLATGQYNKVIEEIKQPDKEVSNGSKKSISKIN